MTRVVESGLADIANRVSAGERPTESVRELLGRFGFHKRRYWTILEIQRGLEAAGLTTDPDFNEGSLDSVITFVPQSKAPAAATKADDNEPPITDDMGPKAAGGGAADASYRLKRLPESGHELVTTSPALI